MARLGLALVLLLVLATPAEAALTTVADVTVPGNGAPQTTVSLPSGPTVIRVTGSVSMSFESCDSLGTQCKGTRTVVVDALYCFAHSGYSDPMSPEYCSESAPGPGKTNWLRFQVGENGAKNTLYGLAGQPDDPYHADHAYRASFNANFAGNRIVVSGSPGSTDHTYSGGIRVEFIQDRTEPEPPTGDPCSGGAGRRAFAARVCDEGAAGAFGVDYTFRAPTIGTPILTRSPTISGDTTTLVGDAHLDGAAPGPLAGVLPVTGRKVTGSKLDDVVLCLVFATAGFDPAQIEAVPDEVRQGLLLKIFVACARLVDPHVLDERAVTSASGCRTRMIAVAVPGRRPSKRALRRAERTGKAALRGSCAADASGSVTFSLKARRRGQRLRGLIGARAAAGFVRTRKPKTIDGANPKLVLNWSRLRR